MDPYVFVNWAIKMCIMVDVVYFENICKKWRSDEENGEAKVDQFYIYSISK